MILGAIDLGGILEQTIQQALGPQAVVFALAALGLNVHFGYTGLLNFGMIGFLAAGAYGMAMTVVYFDQSLWLGIIFGVVFSIALALILGLPTLRLRADYLAIVTIAASEIIRIMVRSTTLEPYTGGAEGIENFADAFYDLSPIEGIPGERFGFGPLTYLANDAWVVIIGWIVVGLATLAVWQWMRSPWGRVVKSIREDEDAARALGKNAYAFKMQSLILGGVLGGMAGMFQVIARQSVQPDTFVPPITFWMWTVLILGGVGRVYSPIVGAMVFWGLLTFAEGLLRELIGNGYISDTIIADPQVGQIRFWIVGIGLILLMVYRPQGLLGRKEEMSLDDH